MKYIYIHYYDDVFCNNNECCCCFLLLYDDDDDDVAFISPSARVAIDDAVRRAMWLGKQINSKWGRPSRGRRATSASTAW